MSKVKDYWFYTLLIGAIFPILHSCQDEVETADVEEVIIPEPKIDTLELIKEEIYDNYYDAVNRSLSGEEYTATKKKQVGLQEVKYYFYDNELALIIASRESSEHSVWRFYPMDGKLSYVSEKFYDQPLDYNQPIPDPNEIISYFHYDKLIYREQSNNENVSHEHDSLSEQVVKDFKSFMQALEN